MPVGEDGKFIDNVAFSKHLRKHSTEAENILREALSSKRLGYKFISQCRIADFFVDFCCRTHKVVIELDGDSHIPKTEQDHARDKKLVGLKYVVLRFRNEDVIEHLEGVLVEIKRVCDERPQWRF